MGNDVLFFFSNVTSLGLAAKTHLFAHHMLSAFACYGVVETHTLAQATPDLVAQCNQLHRRLFHNPAEPTSLRGSHGGEMLMPHSSLAFTDIDADVLASVAKHIPGTFRFSLANWRTKRVSLIIGTAYLWAGEGLSLRNWVILKQLHAVLSTLDRPFYIWGDWNMEPAMLEQSGIPAMLRARLKLPANTTSTANGSGVIDYALYSACLDTMVGDLVLASGCPWAPHYGFS